MAFKMMELDVLRKGCGVMNYGRKFRLGRKYIALFASSILLLYLVFTPFIYYQSIVTVTGQSLRSGNKAMPNPIRQEGKISLLTADVTENLLLMDIVYHIMNRSTQENRHMSGAQYYALILLLSGCGILVHGERCLIRRRRQSLHILAESLGGHAPPYLIYNK